ncbi:MAG: cysteate synthase [Nitrospirota bacterium]
MSHFDIVCRKCGTVLRETYCAFCEHCADALLITRYKEREFSEAGGEGIWRFNWLPVHGAKQFAAGPVVYKSEGLAGRLGHEDLHIAFSGYWPERGAAIRTCTFKEFEAAVVIENSRENSVEGMVVASAGNTARAFAHLSARTGYPVIIVVPRMCLVDMWYLRSEARVPTLVVSDGDYSDAIDLARRVASEAEMPFEGGVKNIAKRDGLGVVLLEAVSKMGRLPGHYFQAVGSGAGAVAAWEMAERFIGDGRFGSTLPRLHLAQNAPFTPMVNAWRRGRRELSPEDLRPELIGEIATRVLSTRYPAYSVMGGVYDALKATDGRMYAVTNEELFAAGEMFEEAEGIDVVPAAAVAVAALVRAVEKVHIRPGDNVLLNITGGGEDRLPEEDKVPVRGELVSKNISNGDLEELLCSTLKKD